MGGFLVPISSRQIDGRISSDFFPPNNDESISSADYVFGHDMSGTRNERQPPAAADEAYHNRH
jgi:hypothetical protein